MGQTSKIWVGRFDYDFGSTVVYDSEIQIKQSNFVYLFSLSSINIITHYPHHIRDRLKTVKDPEKFYNAVSTYNKWKQQHARQFIKDKLNEIKNENPKVKVTGKLINKNPKIEETQTKVNAIRIFSQEQGIKTLIHFTHLKNLSSIMKNGLLSRKQLDNFKGENNFVYNDLDRIDGYPGAICLSISFPNYKMFYRYSSNNRADWVIISLDPCILWELDCAFCKGNAASNAVRHIHLEDRKTLNALRNMYVDYKDIERRDLNIPDNYPTNPQAEVLVFDPIPIKYIKAVNFFNYEVAYRWTSKNQLLHSSLHLNYTYDKRDANCSYRYNYFSPRSDHLKWKSNNNTSMADSQRNYTITEDDIPF